MILVWEDARVWAHWNHSLDMHLNYLGPLSCFSPSWIHSGHTLRGGYVNGGFMATTSFVYWNAGDILCPQCIFVFSEMLPLLIINKHFDFVNRDWEPYSGDSAFWECVWKPLGGPGYFGYSCFASLSCCTSRTRPVPHFSVRACFYFYFFMNFFFFFFGLLNLRSPTRNWTRALAVKAWNPNH